MQLKCKYVVLALAVAPDWHELSWRVKFSQFWGQNCASLVTIWLCCNNLAAIAMSDVALANVACFVVVPKEVD